MTAARTRLANGESGGHGPIAFLVNGSWPNNGGMSETLDGKTALDGAGVETVTVESTARQDCRSSVLDLPWTTINVGRFPKPRRHRSDRCRFCQRRPGRVVGLRMCAVPIFTAVRAVVLPTEFAPRPRSLEKAPGVGTPHQSR